MKPASQRWQQAAHFIHDIGPLAIQLDGVALGASFDVTAYEDALYDVLGVALPAGMRRAVNKRKAEFLCGRFLAALALEQLGGPSVEIGMGEHRQPLWPDGFGGALSHSRDRAACLLSTNARLGLGIDIETIQSDAAAANIAATVVASEERALLEAAAEGFGLSFSAVFSAKESLFKALYPRVRNYFDFHAARLVQLDWRQGRLLLELTQDLGAHYRRADRFELGITHDASRVMTHLVHVH